MASVSQLTIRTVLALLLIVLKSTAVAAAEKPNPKICLVLAGGGAKGLAHIGVIKELERLNIPIDCIAGTSMGALVGGLYAAGMPINEIEKFAIEVDWDATFNDNPQRKYLSFRRKKDEFHYFIKGEVGMRDWQLRLPTGVIQGQQQDMLLENMLIHTSDINDFDQLPIPFRAVATDIETGQAYVLKNGTLPKALRASMSVPGIFAPVEIDGHLLVDGGITNNTPISVARDMGADIIIVSDIHDERKDREKLKNFLDIGNQLLLSLTLNNTLEQLKTLSDQDVLIRPLLKDYTSADFDKAKEIIFAGEIGAKELHTSTALHKLKQPQRPQRKVPQTDLIIDEIKIDNQTHLSEEIILSYISQTTGEELDIARLERDLAYLYGLGFFQNITYDVHNEQNRTVLTIHAHAPSWGPNYFKVKFNMASNLGDQSLFNLGIRHTYLPASKYGGEWRNEFQIGETRNLSTEFYQPLTPKQDFYVRPFANIRNKEYQYNDDSLGLLTLKFKKTATRAGLEFGVNLGTYNRLSSAFYYEDGMVTFGAGTDSERNDHYSENVASVSYMHDSLDQVSFPSKGAIIQAAIAANTSDIATVDYAYSQLLKLSLYKSYHRHTFNLYTEYANIDSNSDYETSQFYTLGGFQRMSGYRENALLGDKIAFGRLKYQYRVLGDSSNIFRFPFYVGATLEAGNVFGSLSDSREIDWKDLKQAGSVYVGFNSPLGPIYTAYGYHNEHIQSIYFYFGHDFD